MYSKKLQIINYYLVEKQTLILNIPKRFSETVLLKHIFGHENDFKFIYIDIGAANTLNALSIQILNKAYSFVGIENFINESKISPTKLLDDTKKIKLNKNAQFTIDLLEYNNNELDFFLHAIETADEIAGQFKINIKVIMNEFLDISKLTSDEALDPLRSVMQHHDNITYILTGRSKTKITEVFEKSASPFFHFGKIITLE